MKKMDAVLIVFYIVITVVMALAAVGFKGGQYDSKTLVIVADGKTIKEISLPISGKMTVPVKTELGYNLVQIEGEEAAIVDADCRDKVCVHSGKINASGEILVCLPHKFIVEIKGVKKKEGEVDSVTH